MPDTETLLDESALCNHGQCTPEHDTEQKSCPEHFCTVTVEIDYCNMNTNVINHHKLDVWKSMAFISLEKSNFAVDSLHVASFHSQYLEI